MTSVTAHSRSSMWIYAGAWAALLMIYAAAFVANGVSIELALRNTIATLLPDVLLGLAVLRVPSWLRSHAPGKARFFAAHFVGLSLFLITATAGWIGLFALDSLLFSGRIDVRVDAPAVTWKLLNDVLIYATLAGIAHAWRNAEAMHEQAERAATAEALRARASLEAMRAQLNPHFILNTFHALIGLVRRDPALAETALERLGDLLRYSLRVHRDGIDEVPLRDECAFVDSYLALERLRLGDRLRVSVDVPSEALEYLVPTFAVQTLVENAVRHAIAPRAAGGLVRIRVEHSVGRMCVTVDDECVGGSVDSRIEGARMGLRLLQERVAALHGSGANLVIRTANGGTSAQLGFPARRSATEAS